jgi:hypothetical protein
MKHRFNRITSLIIFCLALLPGCGSSPPVSIPAPVAGLMSVSRPNSSGKIQVKGAAGSVDSTAEVTVENTTTPATVSGSGTVEDSEGGFTAEIDGDVGDTIAIKQTTSGGTSAATDFTVVSRHPVIGGSPVAGTILPALNRSAVAYSDGTDTTVEIYEDDDDFSLLSSFTVFSFDAFDIAGDDQNSLLCLIDKNNSKVVVTNLSGTLQGSALTVQSPQSVVIDATAQFAVVSSQNASNSLSVIDISAVPSELHTEVVTHPSGETHSKTYGLSVDRDSSNRTIVGALSDFDNGDTFFSFVELNPGNPFITSVTGQVNFSSRSMNKTALFNQATEFLVTEDITGTTDQVIRVSTTDLTAETTISVESVPDGIAVNAAETIAVLANSSSHSVSVIKLSDNSVSSTIETSSGIGLTPFDVSLDDSPATALITNSGDNSATFLDLSAF